MINFNLLSSQSIPGPSPITFNRFQSIAFKFWAILEQKTDDFTFLVKFQVNFSCPKMPVFCLNHRSGPSRSIPNQSGYVQSISSPTGTQKVINLVKKNGLVFTFFMSNFDLKSSKVGPKVHQTYFGPSKEGSGTPQVHQCQVWNHLVQ